MTFDIYLLYILINFILLVVRSALEVNVVCDGLLILLQNSQKDMSRC